MIATHFTLATRFNVALILVWALIVGALLWVTHPRPVLLSTIGATAGLFAGVLQRLSVQSSPALFAEARSVLDVRRAFTSNRSGRLSMAMTWIAGLVLAVIAVVLRGDVPLAFLAGYASFMFVRETVSFGAIKKDMEASRADGP